MEDRKKLDKCIPKIPQRDITINNMDQTINLLDSDMMKLAEAIVAKEISIKSSKVGAEQEREGITLQDWCRI